MQKTKRYYPTILQGWGLLLIILASALVTSIMVLFITNALPGLSKNALFKSFLDLVSYVLLLGATILFARLQMKRSHQGSQAWPKPKLNMLVVLMVIILTPFAIILLDPISIVLPLPEWLKDYMNDAITPNIFSFAAICIAPAILEELLFRGIMLKGMLKNYSPLIAILWSSFFFGIFHFNPWQAIFAFLIGIFLGWLYYRTRSIIPGVIMHAINNGTSFLLALYYPGMDDSLASYMGYQPFFILFAISAVVFVLGCLALNKLMPPPVTFVPEYIVELPIAFGVTEPNRGTTPPEQN